MADTHIQINLDGSTEERKTALWPSDKIGQEKVIRSLFTQKGWNVSYVNNEGGCFWKIKASCPTKSWNINLYISSIRDESRKSDEFKMQLGTTYPQNIEDGWLTVVLGIYALSVDNNAYLLSGYDTKRYSFEGNPSIRGTRTKGLQKAWLYGMYKTDKSILFRPDLLYYYLENIENIHNNCSNNVSTILEQTESIQYNIHTPFLTALRTKPFMLLAGISGTGKSRIVRKLAQATITEELQRANGYTGDDFANDRWTLHSPANFELIQVKPNWHNSMDVIGYLSNIPSPHYVFTPFIEFIVKAWQHPEVPFFLCLDEMNLAPVEEYFAEFLSAIESRSFEGEEYLTDPIIKPFNSFGEEVAKIMVNTLFPNFTAADKNSFLGKVVDHLETKGLTLPKNLIVIGTVNMDETTFSFSRKVLDRAMSVEMNEVNYDSFLTDTTDDDLKAIVKALEENDDADLNTLLVDRHIEAREIIDDLGDDARFAIDYLKRINALLEGTPFKLGYRAANEALIYLQASYEFGQTDRIAALDNFTLMKILSRIEGDETKLKITDSEADKERIAKAEVNVDEAKQYGEMNILTALRYIITNQLGEQDKLHSVKKIDSMLSQLKRNHFVSFWN